LHSSIDAGGQRWFNKKSSAKFTGAKITIGSKSLLSQKKNKFWVQQKCKLKSFDPFDKFSFYFCDLELSNR
jgi:hypothetical protein